MKTNVLDYLEDTTAEYPDKIAFSTVKESISYKTLMDSARMLGSCLASITQPRAPVAVYMDKSCDAIISFMGAVYAGCFYSFIDQRQPLTRLNTIINTLQPSVLIVTDKTLANAQTLSLDCKIINISKMEKDIIDDELLMSIRSQHVDVDPLYCNFTSGSTGTPKGVAICHRSVIDFIEAFTDIFKITSDDVIGNQAPLDFDVSVKDIYSGLKTGAEVVLIPRSYFTFLAKLMKLLDEKQITTLIWAVSALCIISTMDGLNFLLPKSINKVMFSGEVMPNNHLSYWRKYYPNAMFVNLYGPTEITCNCTYHIVDREYGQMESMPIGIPFPNERVFLLDEKNNLVTQPNKDGELCVGGTALALGYYNNPERTSEAFVQNPLNSAYPDIIYRTGDIVNYGEDKLLYFVGRKDFQIKHHGRRIELGEIEIAVSSLDNVKRACVLYMDVEKKIIVYYIGEAQQNEMIKELKTLIPDYMIPNEMISIKAMPLTKNGKLDRKSLKATWHEGNNKAD